MTGALFPCFFKVSSSVDAKPKSLFRSSSGFWSGRGADVVYMNKIDNRRADDIIGYQLLGCSDGTKFRIMITN